MKEKFRFIERYDSPEYETTTLYFRGDKDMLQAYFGDTYPEAGEIELSIEFPISMREACMASVMISPVEITEEAETAYDWWSIYMEPEEVEHLMGLAG